MKTIQELSAGASTASDFTTQAEQWKKEIIRKARAKRYFEQLVTRLTVPDGSYQLKVPRTSSLPDSDFTSDEQTTESNQVTFTDLTGNISSTTFEPGYRRNAVRISNEAIEENAINVVEWARRHLTEYAAQRVDSLIVNQLETQVTAANLAGGSILYSNSSASDVSGITSSDTLTPDLIAEAVRRLRQEDWQNTANEPFVMVIHPKMEESLLKNSQFVNAAEYGSDEVVMNGEIGKYLGIKVLSTGQVTTYSGGDADGTDGATWTGGVDGGSVYVMKSKRPAGIAWQKEAELAAENKLDYNEKRIYLSMKFDVGLLQEDALCIIKCAQA